MSLKNLSVKNKIPDQYNIKFRNKRVSQIYNKFENSFKVDKNFVVAVSGGADSLALAFLTRLFSFKNNLNPKYCIVDHKLRKGSTIEANKVKKILKSLNIIPVEWVDEVISHALVSEPTPLNKSSGGIKSKTSRPRKAKSENKQAH